MQKKKLHCGALCFMALCAALLEFFACKNPYIVHNVSRPVAAVSVEFRTDRDNPGDPAYPLKPVFSAKIMEYEVYVHELAEYVYAAAAPETGASVRFGNARWEGGGTAAFANGAYPFPIRLNEMTIGFKVIKDYREEGPYTVRVIRRPDPGRLEKLGISVAFFDAAAANAGDRSDPASGGWVYESENYIDFAYTALDYENPPVRVPYYTEKIIIKSEAAANIKIAYSLYPRNPRYYPDEKTEIDFNNTANPQIIDFSESRVAGYDAPHLYAAKPLADPASGQRTAYLWVHTVAEDPDTRERRYPQTYKIKLEWDKSYAYLKNLDLRDDSTPDAKKIEGNFFRGNTGYDALVDAQTANIYVDALPRDNGSKVVIRQKTAMDGEDIGGKREYDFPPKPDAADALVNFSFPAEQSKTVFQITVSNVQLALADITYWVTVRRAQPPTRLANIHIQGLETGTGGPWKDLFVFGQKEYGPEQPNYPPPPYAGTDFSSALKKPAALPFSLNDVTDFSFEVDGAVFSRLKFIGYPEDASGTVTYKIGNDRDWPNTQNDCDFNGSLSVTLTAKKENRSDRIYTFTITRTGAQLIELYTDMRKGAGGPPENGDPPPYPPTVSLPPASAPFDDYVINSGERGTFQSLVGGRAVNNALPGTVVTLRVIPKLGWIVYRVYVLKEDGTPFLKPDSTPLDIDAWPECTGPRRDAGPDAYEWDFKMPKNAVRFLASYRFSAGKITNAAYAAPEGKAFFTVPYGYNARGLKMNETDPQTGLAAEGPFAGTSWAYATCNLQGIINEFGVGGNTFTEVWLLEGTYRLEPPEGASTDDGWWAKEIKKEDRGVKSDDKRLNRSFVLRRGLRLYGGFLGKEGGANAADLANSRAMRFNYQKDYQNPPPPPYFPTVAQQQAAARRTILSGALRINEETPSAAFARHVVIAAGIAEPAGISGTGRNDRSSADFYDFDPFTDYGLKADNAADVSLLDTLNIRGGIGTKSAGKIAVGTDFNAGGGSEEALCRNGAGLYAVNSSPYLRNVIVTGNTAVLGGGVYITGNPNTCRPVFKHVVFSNNDAVVYLRHSNGGGGLALQGGMSAILDCQFSNNAAIGEGAGLYALGGTALIRRCQFFLNNATGGPGIRIEGGETWLYESAVRGNTGGNYGISNAGTLYLVNVDSFDGISSGGILSGTNVNAAGGISAGGSFTMTNSTISGLNAAGAGRGTIALGNVVFARGNMVFTPASSSPDGQDTRYACILTNVTFSGGGIMAGFTSTSKHPDNTGAGIMLLNSVRAAGQLSVSQDSQIIDGKKGFYLTMNNVSAGGGMRIDNGSSAVIRNLPDGLHAGNQILDMCVRNSVILWGTPSLTVNTVGAVSGARKVVARLDAASVVHPGDHANNRLYVTSEKAAMINPGDVFRFTDGSVIDADFRVPAITAKSKTAPVKGMVTVEFTSSAQSDFYVAAGDRIVKTGFNISIGSVGSAGSVGSLSHNGSYTWKLSPTQAALLPAGTAFKLFSGSPGGASPRNVVCAVSYSDAASGEVRFTVDGGDTVTAGDIIRINSHRSGFGPIGPHTRPGSDNEWTLSSRGGNQASLMRAALSAAGAGNGVEFWLLDSAAALWNDAKKYTVAPNGLNGNRLNFSSHNRSDFYTGLESIILKNGAVGTQNGYSLTLANNRWAVDSSQSKLLAKGTVFRLLDGTVLRPMVCEVTALNSGEIEFTASAAGTAASGDVILVDIGPAGNADVPLRLPANSPFALPAFCQNDALWKNGTYRIVSGSPDAPYPVSPADYSITISGSAPNKTVTLNKALADISPAGCFAALQTGEVYLDWPGNVVWKKSLLGGAPLGSVLEEGGASWNGLAVSGMKGADPKTAGDVLDGATYRQKSGLAQADRIQDKGDNASSPKNLNELLDQCFARYEERWADTGMRTNMGYALGRLITWEGGPGNPGGLRYNQPGVSDIGWFLGGDNGGLKGDQRNPVDDTPRHNRTAGLIDLGAYEH